MIRLAQAASDENWDITGKEFGDQRQGKLMPDGTQEGEVNIVEWYDYDWTHVFRPISQELAETIAMEAEKAALNPFVGYSQPYCITFFNAFKAAGWDASMIDVPCATHCAAFIAALCNAGGVNVYPTMYTGNQVAALSRTGAFNILTDSTYTGTYSNLKRGDIIFRVGHTAVVLDDAREEETQPYVVVGNNLRLRRGPGLNYDKITYMKLGDIFNVIEFEYNQEEKRSWAKGEYKGWVGYAAVEYLAPEEEPEEIITEETVYVATDNTRIRSGPSIWNKHICYVPKGEKVIYLGESEKDSRGVTWFKVAYGANEGWSSERYLEECM